MKDKMDTTTIWHNVEDRRCYGVGKAIIQSEKLKVCRKKMNNRY